MFHPVKHLMNWHLIEWSIIFHLGLKQECAHNTSRRADMNFRFKPHSPDPFHGKNRSVFRTYVAENEIVCWCWRHSCSYVMLPIDMCIYIHIERVIPIYIRVIGIILLAISPNLPGWAIIEELSISRQSAHFWSVGGRKHMVNIVMLIYRHDMRSGLQ